MKIRPYTRVAEIAQSIDTAISVWKPLSGTIGVTRIAKPYGGYRELYNLSGNLRAANLLLSDVWVCLVGKSAIDFTSDAGGRVAAALQIKAMIEDGISQFILLDVADFFRSIRPDHFVGQPLPRKVFEHVAFCNRYVKLYGRSDECSNDAVRSGLPAGATLSPILANGLIERLLQPVLKDGAVSYVELDKIAAPKLAVDRQVEEGKVTRPALPMQVKTDRPYLLRL